jgi:hypothetical protein
LFASVSFFVFCAIPFFTAITKTERSEPQLLELTLDCLAHAIVTILSSQDSGLQTDSVAACALMKDVTQGRPFHKHFGRRIASHAFSFGERLKSATGAWARSL